MKGTPRVLIVVEGGVVSCVITTVKGLEVCVKDFDNLDCGDSLAGWTDADATVSDRRIERTRREGVR